MTKTINMDLREYENDLNMKYELGICHSLDQFKAFLDSKKTITEFFGAGSLNPKLSKCKIFIDILKALNYDPADIELATTVEEAPTASDAPAPEAASEPCAQQQPAQ